VLFAVIKVENILFCDFSFLIFFFCKKKNRFFTNLIICLQWFQFRSRANFEILNCLLWLKVKIILKYGYITLRNECRKLKVQVSGGSSRFLLQYFELKQQIVISKLLIASSYGNCYFVKFLKFESEFSDSPICHLKFANLILRSIQVFQNSGWCSFRVNFMRMD